MNYFTRNKYSFIKYKSLIKFGITSEDEAAIELNHNLEEEKALIRDGAVYLNYNYVHDYLNDRFYWDANENILLYTTSSNVVNPQV